MKVASSVAILAYWLRILNSSWKLCVWALRIGSLARKHSSMTLSLNRFSSMRARTTPKIESGSLLALYSMIRPYAYRCLHHSSASFVIRPVSKAYA